MNWVDINRYLLQSNDEISKKKKHLQGALKEFIIDQALEFNISLALYMPHKHIDQLLIAVWFFVWSCKRLYYKGKGKERSESSGKSILQMCHENIITVYAERAFPVVNPVI